MTTYRVRLFIFFVIFRIRFDFLLICCLTGNEYTLIINNVYDCDILTISYNSFKYRRYGILY